MVLVVVVAIPEIEPLHSIAPVAGCGPPHRDRDLCVCGGEGETDTQIDRDRDKNNNNQQTDAET